MPTDDIDPFVKTLRPALEERGWTVRVGADKFRIPRGTYHHLLIGKIEISPAWMGVILAALAAMDDIPSDLLRDLVKASVVSQRRWCEKNAEKSAMRRLDEIFSPLIAALESPPSVPAEKKGHAKRAPRKSPTKS